MNDKPMSNGRAGGLAWSNGGLASLQQWRLAGWLAAAD
jgi:hypothetical protein